MKNLKQICRHLLKLDIQYIGTGITTLDDLTVSSDVTEEDYKGASISSIKGFRMLTKEIYVIDLDVVDLSDADDIVNQSIILYVRERNLKQLQ